MTMQTNSLRLDGRSRRRTSIGRTAPRWQNPSLAAACGAVILWASGARAQQATTSADARLSCAQSFEQAQRLRNESHYLAANQEVLKCATPSCGEALFEECTKIYNELQTAMPSVVFAARDKDGNELADVRVTMDGQPSVEKVDGKPLQLDPGSHNFGFSAPGYKSAEHFALIRAGDRFRPVMAVLEPESPAQAAPERAAVPVTPPPTRHPEQQPTPHARAIPVASYVLGGVAVLASVASLGFRAAGATGYHDLQSQCMPHCVDAEVDPVRQKYLLSNIALGVGAAAFAGAITIYVVAPRASAPSLALQVSPTAGGLTTRWSARF